MTAKTKIQIDVTVVEITRHKRPKFIEFKTSFYRKGRRLIAGGNEGGAYSYLDGRTVRAMIRKGDLVESGVPRLYVYR